MSAITKSARFLSNISQIIIKKDLMKSKKKEIFAICVKKMGKLHVKIKMPLAAVVYYGIEKHNEDE